jgi:hypothetical protein
MTRLRKYSRRVWQCNWKVDSGEEIQETNCLSVDFSPVADLNHNNDEDFVVNFVDDSVIANTDAPCVSARQLLDPCGPRLLGQILYCTRDPIAVGLSGFCQLPLGAPLDL